MHDDQVVVHYGHGQGAQAQALERSCDHCDRYSVNLDCCHPSFRPCGGQGESYTAGCLLGRLVDLHPILIDAVLCVLVMYRRTLPLRLSVPSLRTLTILSQGLTWHGETSSTITVFHNQPHTHHLVLLFSVP